MVNIYEGECSMTKEQDDTLKYGLEFTRVIRMYYGRMQAKLADLLVA